MEVLNSNYLIFSGQIFNVMLGKFLWGHTSFSAFNMM